MKKMGLDWSLMVGYPKKHPPMKVTQIDYTKQNHNRPPHPREKFQSASFTELSHFVLQ